MMFGFAMDLIITFAMGLVAFIWICFPMNVNEETTKLQYIIFALVMTLIIDFMFFNFIRWA